MCRDRARPASVLRLVVNPAVTLVAVGVGIGVVMALGTSRLLVSFLVGVAPDDPVTFAAVSALSGYPFHPDAFADLDEIWTYIAEDSIDAADRALADIHAVLRTLAVSPHIGHRRPTRETSSRAVTSPPRLALTF